MAYLGICKTFNRLGGVPVVMSSAVLLPLMIGQAVGNPGISHGADIALLGVILAQHAVVAPAMRRARIGVARGSRYIRRFQMAGYVAGAIGGAMIFNAMQLPVQADPVDTVEASLMPALQPVVLAQRP